MQTSKMITMPGVNAQVASGKYRIVPINMIVDSSDEGLFDADDIGITFQAGPYQKTSNINLSDDCDFSMDNQKVTKTAMIDGQKIIEPESSNFFYSHSLPSPPTPPAVVPRSSNVAFLPVPMNTVNKTQQLERQTSLSIAIEVLQALPQSQISMDVYPPTPSPSDNQDEQCILHPSPSFDYLADGLSRVRTVSEPAEYLNMLPVDDTSTRKRYLSADCTLMQIDGQFVPYYDLTQEQSIDAGSQHDIASTSDSTSDKSNVDVLQSNDSTFCESARDETTTSTLRSLPSFIRTSLENPPPVDATFGDNIDLEGMLQDFLDDADKNLKDQAKVKESIETDHAYYAKQQTINNEDSDATSVLCSNVTQSASLNPALHVIVNLSQESEPSTSSDSTPKMKRTASYIKKRAQNNRACRESRRKRKLERDEAEVKLKTLAEENDAMKIKIEELMKAVKDTRAQLIARMTGQE